MFVKYRVTQDFDAAPEDGPLLRRATARGPMSECQVSDGQDKACSWRSLIMLVQAPEFGASAGIVRQRCARTGLPLNDYVRAHATNFKLRSFASFRWLIGKLTADRG